MDGGIGIELGRGRALFAVGERSVDAVVGTTGGTWFVFVSELTMLANAAAVAVDGAGLSSKADGGCEGEVGNVCDAEDAVFG